MSKKILIIDDDMDLCQLLSRFLKKNGFETEMAHSGAKGLAFFKENNYDLVICDYRLGDMEGIDVLDAIRAQQAPTRVLMITGYSDIKTAVEVIKRGAFDCKTSDTRRSVECGEEGFRILTGLQPRSRCRRWQAAGNG